jgi:antitoxin component HigA of HigAB toxin-antitoxin module
MESVILFGSYINNPGKANDIDLLLMSKNFNYSSKESFICENKKINVIKFNLSEVFAILAKHYQQGDFYKLVFTKGIIITDRYKDARFVKDFIVNSYPKDDTAILNWGLNESLFKLTEYIDILNKPTSLLEYYLISAKSISCLVDWFLFRNNIHNLKSEKFKSRFFSTHFPRENSKIINLITVLKDDSQENFVKELNLLIEEFDISIKEKYSNDLIFDDYSQSSLILYIERLFDFNEIKQIITKIKSQDKDLQFYIYQVDEENQEKTGCYIVFDNSNLEFENKKIKWINFFQNLLKNEQYTFPYNNIFCYPEIKFLGKKNLQLATQLFTDYTNELHNNQSTKENLILNIINTYISKYNIKVNDIYNYYLAKLTAKTHTSNYLTQKQKITENMFSKANTANEKIMIRCLKKLDISKFKVEFPIFNDLPLWFHFQLLNILISPLIKNDFEKLFYINCIKKIHD